jgi:hypothetical protein
LNRRIYRKDGLVNTRTVLAGVALVSQAFAAPLLEERASIGIVTQLLFQQRRGESLGDQGNSGQNGPGIKQHFE